MRLKVRTQPLPRSARDGFSLVELMITLVMLAIVVAVIATVMIGSQRSKADTEGRLEAQQSGRSISDLIAADLRTAGYQVDTDASPSQPPFAYVDSVEIIINANVSPYPDPGGVTNFPRAIDPAKTPMPPKISGNSYTPPMLYGTSGFSAESIRYTLDLNDDGVVDAGDQAVPLATEAQRTANPDDYVIARSTYGLRPDGLNGGSLEKVGLVRGPGSGVPPLYTVYLGSNPNPWDWSNGAIPAGELRNISRIVLKVTSEGRRPRSDGTYPRATLTTEINSLRNSPDGGRTLYEVSGYVYDDLNENGTRDTGEPGVAGAMLRLGTVSVAQSNVNGFYAVQGPPAQYVLHQTVPTGYGPFTADTLVVDFIASPMDVVHSFADTAMAGGYLIDTCWVDTNNDNMRDAGDELVRGAVMSAGGYSRTSNSQGHVEVFLPPGTHAVTMTPPDSMVVVSTNPTTVAITDGVDTRIYTEFSRSGTGKVQGYVFNDTNRNGTKETGETGHANVWVAVTKDAGSIVLAFATTAADGSYEITAPNNMPDATTPYQVVFVPPGGYFPTGSTQISPIWLAISDVLTDKNFGVSNFTSYTLNADRVLSLGVADLLEKDWSGTDISWPTKAAFDKDLVLGSEYVSAPNVSVWWNRMTQTPVFDSTYTYQRNAQAAALSIATGSIDVTSPSQREDVVTGLARKPTGNIAVWLTQNSSGNLGFLVSTPQLYQTTDQGDVNQCLLHDCAGSGALDLIVGTTGIANVGSIEVWTGTGTGIFLRDEVYPPNGSFPGGILGEVKSMLLADVTGDGNRDLIVGTKTGSGTGKIHIMRFNTRIGGDRFRTINTYDVVGEVTCMTTAFVDGDSRLDLVAGTRITSVDGDIQSWLGDGMGNFSLKENFSTQGPVLSIATADMGGTAKNDILYGFRLDESVHAGGLRILFLDLDALPPGDVDPVAGTLDYMTPAIALANFNFRLNTTTPGPYVTDVVAAMKVTSSTGKLLVFIR